MLKKEAEWIAAELGRLDDASLFPLVNLGSSTARVREVEQPFVDEIVFAPLRRRGGAIHHVDAKAAEGVDLALDFSLDSAWERLAALGPRAILCSNVFEHVPDRPLLARRLTHLLRPAAHVLVTVPRAFPHHPDPIDTGFRPGVPELAALFPDLRLLRAAEIDCGRIWQLLSGQERRLARKAISLLYHRLRHVVSGTAHAAARSASPLAWLKHGVLPFRVTCGLFVR